MSGVVFSLSALSLVEAGCKDEKGGAKDTAGPDPAALRAQQALIARREAILTSRNKTQEERKRVQEEMQKVVQSGGDTTEMQNKLNELDSQLAVQNDQLADELAAMTSKLAVIASASDQSAGIASREADLGGREDRLAQREARIADREARMAERERELQKGCVAQSTTVYVPAPAPKPNGNYTRKEIDASLARARTAMGKRGILMSDLPAHAQGLEREAMSALADNEMGKAYLAATQLASTVDAVKIDGPFVKAKIARLQSRISAKGGKLDEATNKSMGAGMADVMQKFGDGDYVRANSKVNQLSMALN